MFRRMTALFLVFVMLGTCLAIAEDVQPEVKTPEEAYEEWFLVVYPLLHSCYANSTWITSNIGVSRSGQFVYLQVRYLLKESPLSFSSADVNAFSSTTKDMKDKLYRMYDFIQDTPVTMATIRTLKASMVKEVPAEYIYVDSLIDKMISDTELLHTQLVNHIEATGTMEGFSTGTGSTKSTVADDWQKIEWIYNFVK